MQVKSGGRFSIPRLCVGTEKETGEKRTRDGLDRLKADIFKGEIRTVVVYKVDRLARRMKDGLSCCATGRRQESGLLVSVTHRST